MNSKTLKLQLKMLQRHTCLHSSSHHPSLESNIGFYGTDSKEDVHLSQNAQANLPLVGIVLAMKSLKAKGDKPNLGIEGDT